MGILFEILTISSKRWPHGYDLYSGVLVASVEVTRHGPRHSLV